MNPTLHEDLGTYINWQNIAGNTIKDLRAVCSEKNLPVSGRNHADYVAAVTAYYQAVINRHGQSSGSRHSPPAPQSRGSSSRSSESGRLPYKDPKFVFGVIAFCASLFYLAWWIAAK